MWCAECCDKCVKGRFKEKGKDQKWSALAIFATDAANHTILLRPAPGI